MKKIVFLICLFCVPLKSVNFPVAASVIIPRIIYTKTSQDVYNFLREDQTNKLTYNLLNFNCIQFSDTLIRDARPSGFIAVEVHVYWPEYQMGHRFVAFYTVDKGVIWIEPQSDTEYRVVDFSKTIHDGEDRLCPKYGKHCWPGEIVQVEYIP